MALGVETQKNHQDRMDSGFYKEYCQGVGLDVGYRGAGVPNVEPLPNCIGVDLGFPGYDGKELPFPDNSVDFVFSSHCLEHIEDPFTALREWLRVARRHVVIAVPHQFLYEKRKHLPSKFNTHGHLRFYTPASLLTEIEQSLTPNTYRIVHLIDNDHGFDYTVGPEEHSKGCYEVECVIKKIKKPKWDLA